MESMSPSTLKKKNHFLKKMPTFQIRVPGFDRSDWLSHWLVVNRPQEVMFRVLATHILA